MKYYSTIAAGDMLGCSRHWIGNKARAGHIPGAFRTARLWNIPESWIEQQQQGKPVKKGRPMNSMKAFLKESGCRFKNGNWRLKKTGPGLTNQELDVNLRGGYSLGSCAGDAVWTLAATFRGELSIRARELLKSAGCRGFMKTPMVPVFKYEDGKKFGGDYVSIEAGLTYFELEKLPVTKK